MVDALVVHGDADTVAARLTEHLDAGADHVCAQILAGPGEDPLPALRTLAEALRLTRPERGQPGHHRDCLRAANGVIIGTIMAEPIWFLAIRLVQAASARIALADLLGRWPTADGPLYRLLAARIARLADTGELPAGLRLPPERDLAAALSVSRNTVAAAYQLLRDEGMAESRQGAGTRIVPHRTTPAAVHRANGFFAGPARDLGARRGPQPGRGGLRAAGGGGAGRPGHRPGRWPDARR